MAEIITLGEILIDFFSTRAGISLAKAPRFVRAPGGAPANVAVGVARLGRKSAFIGKVGNDHFGNFLKGVLDENGVDNSQVKVSNQMHTTLAFIARRADGEPEFCFYRNPGADLELEPDDICGEFISRAQIFHFGSLSLVAGPCRQATLKAVEYAKQAGLLVSYDPNLRLSLWNSDKHAKTEIITGLKVSDIVKVNNDELYFITGQSDLEDAIATFFQYGPKVVFVTQGGKETIVASGNQIQYVDSFNVPVKDPVGCGDSFVAAVLVQLLPRMLAGDKIEELDNGELRKIAQHANAAAALTSLKVGVIPALPRQEEVASLLEQRRE